MIPLVWRILRNEITHHTKARVTELTLIQNCQSVFHFPEGNWIQTHISYWVEYGKHPIVNLLELGPLLLVFKASRQQVQSEQVVSVDGLSDEEKRRLAQELLASLQASAGGENADDAAAQEAPVQEEKSDEQNTDEKSE